MHLKRRILQSNQDIIIIYRRGVGYVQEKAVFKYYKSVQVGKVQHQTPFFQDHKGDVVSGLDCFWLLPTDIKSVSEIEQIQYELIETQILALEIAYEHNYEFPNKMTDKTMEAVAQQNTQKMQALIKKFGFDPRDTSWIETHLAENKTEQDWFKFESANQIIFDQPWEELVNRFNLQFKNSITVEMAKVLSRKRMRFILGAYNTRLGGNANTKDWVETAKEFEKAHRERETRMLEWTIAHQNHFPMVRTKEPLQFWPGPYFNQCVEKAPHVFTDVRCTKVKKDVVLRVISYDPIQKYMRLDFASDIRQLIKPNEPDTVKPWHKDDPDYDIWIKPEEIETHLELLEPLT